MSGLPSENDLNALIDNELEPARRAEMEVAVARDPGLAAHVARLRADKAALAAAYGGLARAPMPARLLAAARTAPARSPPLARWRRPAIAAAAIGIAALLLLTLLPRAHWMAARHDPAVEEALAARDGASAPARELDDPAGLADADQAISGALHNPARAPDLRRAGFSLVSVEIYGKDRTDAVQLRYRDDSRRSFTVYLRPPAGPDGFKLTRRGDLRICVWQNADLTAIMSGKMSVPELFRLSSLAYSSLNL